MIRSISPGLPRVALDTVDENDARKDDLLVSDALASPPAQRLTQPPD